MSATKTYLYLFFLVSLFVHSWQIFTRCFGNLHEHAEIIDIEAKL